MSKLNTIKKIALAIGIIIVLNLFFNFGIQTFYQSPKFENFCLQEIGEVRYGDRMACESADGRWIESGIYPYGDFRPVPAPLELETEREGYCDVFYNCRNEFQDERKIYDRNVFIILMLAGAAAFVVGLLVNAVVAVSSGFVFGGVLSFLIGTIRYWSDMHDYLRFVILGLILLTLIWIGYKKLRE